MSNEINWAIKQNCFANFMVLTKSFLSYRGLIGVGKSRLMDVISECFNYRNVYKEATVKDLSPDAVTKQNINSCTN